MSMNLEGHRWWVMAMAVLLGSDAANALADDKPQSPAAQVDSDRTREIERSVANLGGSDPAIREAASARLVAIGKPARAALAQAAKSDDPELRIRAQALLAKLEIPLAVVLSAPSGTIKVGQPFPPVAIEIRNATEQPITVMTPIDGCDIQWRVVRYEWVVTDANGQDVPRRGLGRCGNTNPLTAADFTEVAPGKSVTITPGKTFLADPATYFPMHKPGTYKVALRYAFDPDRKQSGLGSDVGKEKLAELLAKTLRAEVVSNVLTIEVRE